MLFASSLISGVLIAREKKVLATVLLDDGREVTAYCPNFSDIKDILHQGSRVYLNHNVNPRRRAKYILELVESSGSLVSINNAHNVPLVTEAIISGRIEELSNYRDISWRIDALNLGFSGVDVLLSGNKDDSRNCYVAISNILLKRKAEAVFPDDVSVGSQRQLLELEEIVKEGGRAVLLFLVRRMDCLSANMVWDIDPLYSGVLVDIINKGVEVACYSCSISLKSIVVDKSISVFI
ncbi:MAG: DNA/RNA nuclease SfsA [Alphaproteobacteria bacterium]